MSKPVAGKCLLEIQDLRKSLEKAVKGNESAGAVMDILLAIETLKMTPDLIKDSKMGKVLVSIRTKFSAEDSLPASNDVTNKARDILVEWKKIVENHMKKQKMEKSSSSNMSSSPSKNTETVLKAKKVAPSAELPACERMRDEVASYPDARRKVSLSSTSLLQALRLFKFKCAEFNAL
jgi:TFIIS helical bundle-like domain